jgi:hypothetical protein
MRDLERRMRRLEDAPDNDILLVWRGWQSADEAMIERFGSTREPPGVTVYLLTWGDGGGDEAEASRTRPPN